jgi:hypothetical protein
VCLVQTQGVYVGACPLSTNHRVSMWGRVCLVQSQGVYVGGVSVIHQSQSVYVGGVSVIHQSHVVYVGACPLSTNNMSSFSEPPPGQLVLEGEIPGVRR